MVFNQPRTASDLANYLNLTNGEELIPYLAELTARNWVLPRALGYIIDATAGEASELQSRLNSLRHKAELLPRLLDRSRLWFAFFTEISGNRSTWLWRGNLIFTSTRQGERVLDQETWCIDLMTRYPSSAITRNRV
ncbi:MAG: hypothetical protein GY835_15170 [bacterium]|nr:hypothetical protein [bacterium]